MSDLAFDVLTIIGWAICFSCFIVSAWCNGTAELRLSTTPRPPFPRSLITPRLSWSEVFTVQAEVRRLRRLAHTKGSDMDPEFRQLFVRERRFRVAAFLIGFVVLTANWTRSDDSVSRPVPQATSEAAPDR